MPWQSFPCCSWDIMIICLLVKDPCDRHVCLNGGTCMKRSSGPYCTCTSQYTGNHCEKGKAILTFVPQICCRYYWKQCWLIIIRRVGLCASTEFQRHRPTLYYYELQVYMSQRGKKYCQRHRVRCSYQGNHTTKDFI